MALTAQQLYNLISQAAKSKGVNIPEGDKRKLVATAFGESGARVDAFNGANSNGSWDAGLWQINSIHGYDKNRLLSDPAYNAAAAVDVYAGQGLDAWVVYNTGKYEQYMPQANAVKGATGDVPTGQQGITAQDAYGIQQAWQGNAPGYTGQQPQVSTQDALAAYGFTQSVIDTIPELKGVFNSAVQQGWDENRFANAVKDTAWWKSTTETKRAAELMRAQDPATYDQKLGDTRRTMSAMAQQLGITGLSDKELGQLSTWAFEFQWDQTHMQQMLTSYGKLGKNYGGLAGETEQQIKEIAHAYGVPYRQKHVDSVVKGILSGRDTVEGYRQRQVAAAKSMFPSFSDQIDAGMTMLDIADPYIQQMASTLEIPAGDLNLNTKLVKKALQARNDKGQPQPKQLWEFEQDLRKDARFDKTKGAAEEASALIAQVGSDWGFLGNG